MTHLEKYLSEEEKQSLVRYFKLLLRVLKRLKEEIQINPSIVDNLEPEFRLLLAKY